MTQFRVEGSITRSLAEQQRLAKDQSQEIEFLFFFLHRMHHEVEDAQSKESSLHCTCHPSVPRINVRGAHAM